MIRKAVKSDVPGVLEIEKDLFSDPWDKRLFEDAIEAEDKHFFVAEEADKLAGYVIFEKVLDEGHITNLAVAKEYQKHGTGTNLVNCVIELARQEKLKEIFLEVRESNEAAKVLYSKFGFKEVGRRKRYYPKANEDALIFRLNLERKLA